jgi:uncharacterized membrane protein YfhO
VLQARHVDDGRMAATVDMHTPGVAVFSASFDPGWKAKVDGRPAPVFAVAPALVATRLPAGRHTIAFQYAGFSGYAWLFALSALSLMAFAVTDLARRKRRSLD